MLFGQRLIHYETVTLKMQIHKIIGKSMDPYMNTIFLHYIVICSMLEPPLYCYMKKIYLLLWDADWNDIEIRPNLKSNVMKWWWVMRRFLCFKNSTNMITLHFIVASFLHSNILQGVPHFWAHFVFVIFSGSREHTEELFIAIG